MVIIVLIIAAAFVHVIQVAPLNTITQSVQSYFNSGDYTISSDEAQNVFDETGSLVLATDTDIQNISKETLYKLKAQSEVLYNSISDEGYVGSHKIADISYAKGFNITNAYEFMLNAERLNFNRIIWKEVTREETPQVKDIELTTDEDTNLKYPDNDEDDKELEDFADMVIPYLQSYIIPTSMLSGIAAEDIGNVLGNFAYQIMDKAYHQIQINQYTVQNVTKHQSIIKYITDNITVDLYTHTIQYMDVCVDEETGVESPCMKTTTQKVYDLAKLKADVEALKEKYNNALVEGEPAQDYYERIGVLDTSKYFAEKVDKDIVYGVVEAETIKSYMSVEYEQKIYNQNDVDNFLSADSVSMVGVKDYNTVNAVINDKLSGYLGYNTLTDCEPAGTLNLSVEVGQDFTYKHYWQDDLDVKDTVQRNYTTNDVIAYLSTDNIEKTKRVYEYTQEEIDEEIEYDYKLTFSDTQYYDSLESDKELNKIDIINSDPDVYNDYLQEGTNFSTNIGFSRSHLSQSYQMMKNYLAEYTGTIDYGTLLNNFNSGIDLSGIIGLNFIWPLNSTAGSITSCAGERGSVVTGIGTEKHGAMDVGIAGGTEIIASQSGTIYIKTTNIRACKDQYGNTKTCGYGNYIVIKHDNDPDYTYYTLYAHMSKFGSYKVGDKVNVGDVIGYVGTTGGSTGNHLHFEIKQVDKGVAFVFDKSLNLEPIKYIQRDTIPEGILNDNSLPSNCGDMTTDMFGSLAATYESDDYDGYMEEPYEAYDKSKLPKTVAGINEIIDQMSDIEIMSRLIYAEQSVGSRESQVLVGLSILNSGASVKAKAKSTYSNGNHYSYNCIAKNIKNGIVFGGFWDAVPDKYIGIAEEAVKAKEKGTYVVTDDITGQAIECISIKQFRATEPPSYPTPESLPDNWDNLTKKITLHNYSTSYTCYYW